MDNVEKVFEEKMQKTMNVLKNELNAVRAGRANPALLDKVIVEYYGTPTPLTTQIGRASCRERV